MFVHLLDLIRISSKKMLLWSPLAEIELASQQFGDNGMGVREGKK